MVAKQQNKEVSVLDEKPIPLEAFGGQPGKVTIYPDGDLSRAIVEDLGGMVVGVDPGNPRGDWGVIVWIRL
jgi:hypothetical protein